MILYRNRPQLQTLFSLPQKTIVVDFTFLMSRNLFCIIFYWAIAKGYKKSALRLSNSHFPS